MGSTLERQGERILSGANQTTSSLVCPSVCKYQRTDWRQYLTCANKIIFRLESYRISKSHPSTPSESVQMTIRESIHHARSRVTQREDHPASLNINQDRDSLNRTVRKIIPNGIVSQWKLCPAENITIIHSVNSPAHRVNQREKLLPIIRLTLYIYSYNTSRKGVLPCCNMRQKERSSLRKLHFFLVLEMLEIRQFR